MSDGDNGSGGGAADILLGGDGGAVTPPAVEPGAVTPPVVEGAADPDWYSNLSAEGGEGEAASNRDWVKSRGAKTLDDVVKGFRDTQRALHDKGMVKVPGEGATPEETTAFRKAIGVPDTVEGYKFEGPKDDAGNPLPLAEGLVSAARRLGMRYGL